MNQTSIITVNGSILDCSIGEAVAVIVPPGLTTLKPEGEMFFEKITGSLPQDTFDLVQVKSGNGILRYILYVDTSDNLISNINDMKELVCRILKTFAGLGVKEIAMNGVRCDDRPDMKIRPEKYQRQIIERYVAENPESFDKIALVDLRGGFSKNQ